jgi:hypothetical protein
MIKKCSRWRTAAPSKNIALAREDKTTRGASSSNNLPVCGFKDRVLVIFYHSKKAKGLFFWICRNKYVGLRYMMECTGIEYIS